MSAGADDRDRLSRPGLLNLLVVYVVWGSTYLAIRVVVREGSGFPPFSMAAMRTLTAAAIMLGWARLAGQRLRLTRGELSVLAVTGLLFWTAANGLVVWGEQRADSGLAALLVGTMPIWAAALDAVVARRRPSPLLVLSLLCGFAGVAVLSLPVLRTGVRADLMAVVALSIAPAAWAVGTVVMQRRRPDVGLRVAAGYQQLFGGIGFAAAALILGEPRPAPIAEAWLAWGYLVVFGSLWAFTAFVQTVRLLPINIASTYAFVNPVIAVFLGWLILREAVTPTTAAGALLVIAGVAGIFRNRGKRSRNLDPPAASHPADDDPTRARRQA